MTHDCVSGHVEGTNYLAFACACIRIDRLIRSLFDVFIGMEGEQQTKQICVLLGLVKVGSASGKTTSPREEPSNRHHTAQIIVRPVHMMMRSQHSRLRAFVHGRLDKRGRLKKTHIPPPPQPSPLLQALHLELINYLLELPQLDISTACPDEAPPRVLQMRACFAELSLVQKCSRRIPC